MSWAVIGKVIRAKQKGKRARSRDIEERFGLSGSSSVIGFIVASRGSRGQTAVRCARLPPPIVKVEARPPAAVKALIGLHQTVALHAAGFSRALRQGLKPGEGRYSGLFPEGASHLNRPSKGRPIPSQPSPVNRAGLVKSPATLGRTTSLRPKSAQPTAIARDTDRNSLLSG